MKLSIGCSGWSYTDWVGSFYPRELAQKHGEWLSYYSLFFKTAEVNTTFYSVPDKRVVDSWISRVEDREFEFSLKLPRTITHEKLISGDWDGISRDYNVFRENCVRPLEDAGRLGSVLVQLPHDARYPDALKSLERLLMVISSTPISVEFRHTSFVDEKTKEIQGDVLDMLELNNAAAVFVDSPAFPITRAITSSEAYIRFHGRNRDVWFTGVREDDERINRYDYLYSRRQLEEWVPRIREIASSTAHTRIYFNNHGRAKAARNALELMDMLGIAHEPKEIRISEQLRLERYN
jgi:uncharacterized protein YecE (DUF72 family)